MQFQIIFQQDLNRNDDIDDATTQMITASNTKKNDDENIRKKIRMTSIIEKMIEITDGAEKSGKTKKVNDEI